MTTKTYKASDVSIVVAGVPLRGTADGTFVVIARDNPLFTKKIGADGEVARSRSSDMSGSIKVTLLQSSASHDYLSQLYQADEKEGAGIFPVTVRDGSGTTIAFAAEAWVQKLPDVSFGKELTDREWTLDTGRLELFAGGTNS